MAATEAAKSAACTVNQLSEILKAVLPAVVPQGERADPDPTPVGRPPPAPPPSTTPFQTGEQREPVRTDQMPEKLSKIMERKARNFFANNSDTCIAHRKDWNRRQKQLSLCKKTLTVIRPDADLSRGASRGPNWTQRGNMQAKLTTRGKSLSRRVPTKREVMSQMHHAFTTFQKEVEAQAQEASCRNLSTRATRGAYDSVMRSSTEEFVKSEDIDINGDKLTSGVLIQVIEQFSAELYKKAYERVVKEIVDKREKVAKI